MAAAKKSGDEETEEGNVKRRKMLLGLSEEDRKMLDDLIKRYKKTVARPNKAWVLRQLIRNAHAEKKLPPVVVADDD